MTAGVPGRFLDAVTDVRPRLGLAVEPAMFGQALASALQEVDVDDVVHLDSLPAGRAQEFDAVVATVGLPEGVRAPVVIRLPHDSGGRGRAVVEAGGERAEVEIDRLTALLGVLDVYCPGPRRRRASA
jgi:hypothetical protein